MFIKENIGWGIFYYDRNLERTSCDMLNRKCRISDVHVLTRNAKAIPKAGNWKLEFIGLQTFLIRHQI